MGSHKQVCPPKRKATDYEADNGDDGVNAIVAPYLPYDRNVVIVPMVPSYTNVATFAARSARRNNSKSIFRLRDGKVGCV